MMSRKLLIRRPCSGPDMEFRSFIFMNQIYKNTKSLIGEKKCSFRKTLKK